MYSVLEKRAQRAWERAQRHYWETKLLPYHRGGHVTVAGPATELRTLVKFFPVVRQGILYCEVGKQGFDPDKSLIVWEVVGEDFPESTPCRSYEMDALCFVGIGDAEPAASGEMVCYIFDLGDTRRLEQQLERVFGVDNEEDALRDDLCDILDQSGVDDANSSYEPWSLWKDEP